VADITNDLIRQGYIKNPNLFRRYVAFKKIDRLIQPGQFTVDPPVTIARIADALCASLSKEERQITIVPGWDLRQVAVYLVSEHPDSEAEFFSLVGTPAIVHADMTQMMFDPPVRVLQDKPNTISLEGYLRPDTYRIFEDATTEEIIEKLVRARDAQFTDQMYADIAKNGRTVHDVLTVASIVEREVLHDTDRAKVADILWRRTDAGMGLNVDSSIHYFTGKRGDVFTTQVERNGDNPWNTYKWRGLPPGPISNPSLLSIMATIYPEKNSDWYFLTTLDTGEVVYGKTLDEHNGNVGRYLRD